MIPRPLPGWLVATLAIAGVLVVAWGLDQLLTAVG